MKKFRRVREEIAEVIKSESDITFENLKRLTYIDCIQKETGRMYGTTGAVIYREVLKDSMIKNIPILKGSMVAVQSMGSRFNPFFLSSLTYSNLKDGEL